MSGSPLRYDKFSYAVKRKPERETASPHGTAVLSSPSRNGSGLQPLPLTRDGFAIAEDGSLMSRVVSPPRWTPGNGPVVFASTAPTVVSTPGGGHHAAAPPPSPASTYKNTTAAKSPASTARAQNFPQHADPWGALVKAVTGKLTEDDLAVLSWDTVSELLQHFGIVNPVDVGRVQLVWRRKQDLLLGLDTLSEATTGHAASYTAETPERGSTPSPTRDDTVLVLSPPEGKALKQQPIMQIAYGRPASPRRGGRFIPDHKKPLNWKAEPKVDTGLTPKRSSSRQD